MGKDQLTTRRNGAGPTETQSRQGHNGHFFQNLRKEDSASAGAAGQTAG